MSTYPTKKVTITIGRPLTVPSAATEMLESQLPDDMEYSLEKMENRIIKDITKYARNFLNLHWGRLPFEVELYFEVHEEENTAYLAWWEVK